MSKSCNNIRFQEGISSYISLPSEENHTVKSTSRKTERVFQAFSSVLNTIFTLVATGFFNVNETRRRIFSKVIVSSMNRGKIPDWKKYFQLSQAPAILNEDGKKIIENHGFQYEELAECKINPKLMDRGKCFGAVTLFMADYLSSELRDIQEVAKRFEGGVPIEGVLAQEIGRSLVNLSYVVDENLQELKFALCDILLMGEARKKFNKEGYQDLPENYRYIVKEFHHVLSETNELDSIIEYMKLSYNLEFREELPTECLTTIEQVLRRNFGMLEKKLAVAQLCGLESEVTLWRGDTDEVLETIPTLPEGVYSLSFPVKNFLGTVTGSHVISLIIDESGFTYLYDPNYGIGRIDDPVQSIAKLLKLYNSQGKTGILARILGIFRTKRDFSTQESWPQFCFTKYRKFQQI